MCRRTESGSLLTVGLDGNLYTSGETLVQESGEEEMADDGVPGVLLLELTARSALRVFRQLLLNSITEAASWDQLHDLTNCCGWAKCPLGWLLPQIYNIHHA